WVTRQLTAKFGRALNGTTDSAAQVRRVRIPVGENRAEPFRVLRSRLRAAALCRAARLPHRRRLAMDRRGLFPLLRATLWPPLPLDHRAVYGGNATHLLVPAAGLD